LSCPSFFHIGLVENVYGIQGIEDASNTCHAYSFTPAITHYYGYATQIMAGTYVADPLVDFTNTYDGNFYESYWGGLLTRYYWTGTAWQGPYNIMAWARVIPQVYEPVKDFVDQHGIPYNQTPNQYWPTGPPADCGLTVEKRNNLASPCPSGQCCNN